MDNEVTTRTPAELCWHCSRLLDAADPIHDDTRTEPGMISICMYCGAIGVFGPDLILLKPTKELLDDLAEDHEFMNTFATFQWARQYLALKASLLGSEAEAEDQ